MHWLHRLDILRWRSLEEGDSSGGLLAGETRREATAQANATTKLTSKEAIPASQADDLLDRRSRWLNERAGGSERTAGALKAMRVPDLRMSWQSFGWLAAMAAGFMLTGIGSEAEINLLALPLVGLLLWNFAVMAAAFVIECLAGKPGQTARPGWLAELIAARCARTRLQAVPASPNEAAVAVGKFHERALPLAMERLKTASRSWLHIAAALLALGSCIGMYAKGWSREYRAVWESTLLDAPKASVFFRGLFGPASRIFNLPLPADQISRMQRGQGRNAEPSPALPWIHLYAGTLVIFIVVPRLALVAIAFGRGRQRLDARWQRQQWPAYAARLLRAIEGGGEMVPALLHGIKASAAGLERWTLAVQDIAGGGASLETVEIPPGDEDEFTAIWQSPSHLAAVIFQLAATPEEEVQRKLVRELRSRLRAKFADGRLIVLLDAVGVQGRWDDEQMRSRTELWRRMIESEADDWLTVGEMDGANRLQPGGSRAV